jgi:hypothetical protein
MWAGNMTVVIMKIGIVISGGDVSGINNFIFRLRNWQRGYHHV